MSAENESHYEDLPKSIYIRNYPFLNSPFLDLRKVEAAMDYMPKNGDIILCSYPKTGTTWTQYLIWEILHKGGTLPTYGDMTIKLVPFMEMTGIEPIEALTTLRFYKNHFPYHLMKINKNAKYIYIHRNPMDTLVSYYHFMMSIFQCSFKFDDFYESFVTGEIGYGDYFDHILSFDLHKNDSHILLISYEDLHKDKRAQILRLAKFLGDEYYQALVEDEALLQKILNVTTFGYMKENVNTNLSEKGDDLNPKRHVPMFRKGIIGEGRNVLHSTQIERLQQKMLAKMKGTHYVEMWSS